MATEPKYSMPDGSYPINSCADVTKAANLAHHSKKYSFAEVKAMILKASEGLSCPKSVLPATWDESDKNAVMPIGEVRAMSNFDPDNDGDDDSSPETDTDHDFWDTDGNPIMEAWLAVGATPPGGDVVDPDEEISSPGVMTSVGYGPNGMASTAPRDNLVRALPQGFELRSDAASLTPEFEGIFSRFNDWYPVSELGMGDFMEQVLPGSFAETIKRDKGSMKVLFNHGQDPSIGDKPLGPIRTLKEQEDGPYFDGPFLDTDYNANQIIPMLQGRLMDGTKVGSQLGSSFRFQVQEDRWNMHPKPTKMNPNGIPQRSIIRARVFEFGPVVFPANAGATASARSMTDEWYAHLISETWFQRQLADRVGSKVAERILAAVPTEVQQEIIHQQKRSSQDRLRRQAQALLALSA